MLAIQARIRTASWFWPVWFSHRLFEHRQQRGKWKEALLETARRQLQGWVSLVTFIRKSTQNPLEQIGADLDDRSDPYHRAGFRVAAKQPEVDGPVEQFCGQLALLQRLLVEPVPNDRAKSRKAIVVLDRVETGILGRPRTLSSMASSSGTGLRRWTRLPVQVRRNV